MTGAPYDNFRKNICSEDDLIPIIFGSLDFQLGNPNRFLGDKNMPISTV